MFASSALLIDRRTSSGCCPTSIAWMEMGGVFAARRPPFDVDLDPFLNIDLFHVTGIVFAPHPHAGFSAVTYLFDDSTTPIRNRDSLGDNGLI